MVMQQTACGLLTISLKNNNQKYEALPEIMKVSFYISSKKETQ